MAATSRFAVISGGNAHQMDRALYAFIKGYIGKFFAPAADFELEHFPNLLVQTVVNILDPCIVWITRLEKHPDGCTAPCVDNESTRKQVKEHSFFQIVTDALRQVRVGIWCVIINVKDQCGDLGTTILRTNVFPA